MGKGGSAPTQSTVVQTNLPDYYEPYAMRLMDRAEGASLADYTPYGGQRIADVSPDRAAAYDLTRQVAGQGIPGLDAAFGTVGNTMMRASDAANVNPMNVSGSSFSTTGAQQFGGFKAADPRSFANEVSAYQGFNSAAGGIDPYANFKAGSAEAYQFGPERQFTTQEAQQYMDPYLNTVLGVQKDQARQDYDRSRADRDARAVQAGAFGGSRAAVQEGLAESEMLDRMARIDAEGRSAAYGQAASQFGLDRTAQQSQRQAQAAEIARTQGISIEEAARIQNAEAAEIARVQGISIEEASRIQSANAAEQARVQRERIAEQARAQGISIEEAARVQNAQAGETARVQEFTAAENARVQEAKAADKARMQELQSLENARARQDSLEALGLSAEMAGQLAGIGEMARAGDIQAAQLLETIGTAIEAQDQAGLDLAYQDFINQRDYDKNQINYLSSVMQGVPVTPETATTTMAPYNPAQQALGAGLGAVGLYRGLTA